MKIWLVLYFFLRGFYRCLFVIFFIGRDSESAAVICVLCWWMEVTILSREWRWLLHIAKWVVPTLRYYRSHRCGSVRRWTESPGVGEWSSALSSWFPVQTNPHHIQHHTLTASLSFVSEKNTRFFVDFLDSFVAYSQDVKAKCCYVFELVTKLRTIYFCQITTKPKGELIHLIVPYPNFMKVNSLDERRKVGSKKGIYFCLL